MKTHLSFHAAGRAKERYSNVFVSQQNYQKLYEQIKSGSAQILCHQGLITSIRKAKIDSKEVYFVWNRMANRVVTFLPYSSIAGVENNRCIREFYSQKNNPEYVTANLPDAIFHEMNGIHGKAKFLKAIDRDNWIFKNTLSNAKEIYYIWNQDTREIIDVISKEEVGE